MNLNTEQNRASNANFRWKIGEVAVRTGLSVRALHHYESSGLVTARRTDAGHREYTSEQVARLKRIASLRSLGLSLEEIRACFSADSESPQRPLELRLAATREQLAELQRDAEQLEQVLLTATASQHGGAFDLWTALDVLSSIEEQLEPEQYAKWTQERRALGATGLAQRDRTFRELVLAIRHEFTLGTPPDVEPMPSLARRWEEFAQETYGYDEELRSCIAVAVSKVPGLSEQLGVDRALLRYVGQALG